MDLFTQYTALASLAVVVVQQILKLNAIPVYFANQYPVATNVVLSVIAAVVVSWQDLVKLNGWVSWVVEIATISVIAAITYNMTLRNSEAVQRASTKVKNDL
jgi:hypothetical protein